MINIVVLDQSFIFMKHENLSMFFDLQFNRQVMQHTSIVRFDANLSHFWMRHKRIKRDKNATETYQERYCQQMCKSLEDYNI